MNREEQNALLDTAKRCYLAVLAANPPPGLTPCDHCGGHAPPTSEQKTAHQLHVKLTSAIEKIEKIRWATNEDGGKLPKFKPQAAVGTEIAGWKKRPRKQWSYRDDGMHQTVSADILPTYAGEPPGPVICTDGGDPIIELPIVLDLLAQMIQPTT